MSTNKQGMFVMSDGKNLVITFILVSSLFLLWGFCNGMIDVMDKHFSGGTAPDDGAIRKCAMGALSWLFPDGFASRMVGNKIGL